MKGLGGRRDDSASDDSFATGIEVYGPKNSLLNSRGVARPRAGAASASNAVPHP